jgi:hypothetical protein
VTTSTMVRINARRRDSILINHAGQAINSRRKVLRRAWANRVQVAQFSTGAGARWRSFRCRETGLVGAATSIWYSHEMCYASNSYI